MNGNRPSVNILHGWDSALRGFLRGARPESLDRGIFPCMFASRTFHGYGSSTGRSIGHSPQSCRNRIHSPTSSQILVLESAHPNSVSASVIV